MRLTFESEPQPPISFGHPRAHLLRITLDSNGQRHQYTEALMPDIDESLLGMIFDLAKRTFLDQYAKHRGRIAWDRTLA